MDSNELLCQHTADRIAAGKIVGWFQGRMEWGPRALENRSIVADPRRAEMKDILNRRIKHREPFRPFAPSDVEMVFVGDGVKKPVLEDRVRTLGLDNVRFLPYQAKGFLKDSFASADVFVVSLKEGLAGYIVPSKLYGILAAGRPYVAVVEESCEVAAITKQYDCGLLAEPGDPEDLARKILTLYQNRDLARHLGTNARRAALEFDRHSQIRAYYELFHKVAPVSVPTVNGPS